MGRHGLDWSGSGLGTGGGRLWVQLWTFWFQKMRGISWLAENRVAAHGWLCSMESDSLLLNQTVLTACKIPTVIKVHSLSWETNSYSVSVKKIWVTYKILKFYHVIQSGPPLLPILTQMNTAHTLPSKIHLILCSHLCLDLLRCIKHWQCDPQLLPASERLHC
jgi:hypothetical protein